MSAERCTLAELADALSTTVDSVRRWQREGMPGSKVRGRWHFDVEACKRWRAEHQRTLDAPGELKRADAELRKALALARARELDLAERLSQLVSLADMREAVAARFDAIRRRLTSLPKQVSPMLEGLERHQIEQALRAELDAVLDQVGSAELRPDLRVRALPHERAAHAGA